VDGVAVYREEILGQYDQIRRLSYGERAQLAIELEL
jgi:hypothetical protein